MDSLQVKAYEKLFDNLTSETQELLLEKLLKSTTGENVLYNIELSKMMKWFTRPIPKMLIGRCSAAGKYFLNKFEYNSAWENIDVALNTWFNRDYVDTHVSDDGKIVFISPKNLEFDFSRTIINEKNMTLNNEYDINIILNTDFDLNNLYMGDSNVENSNIEKWWIFCRNMA